MTPLLNHLWQSTLFGAAAALLALALRHNAARIRFWVWLAASMKFLVPFSLLTTLGARIGTRTVAMPAAVSAGFSIVIEDFGRPFSTTSAPLPQSHFSLAGAALTIWALGALAVIVMWCVRWWRLRATVKRATPIPSLWPIPLLSSDSTVEPGIVGIFHPVLLLPAGITSRLSDAHLDAIVAHELCHVRRRDNLLALIHMAVEAIFWFHPLVWWLGARLVEERERACDEEVLQRGSEPEIYAEGILKVCQFYVESSLVCAAGITGADLKHRIEAIMTHGTAPSLRSWQRVLLATSMVAVIAAPVLVGMAQAPVIHADPAPPVFVASGRPQQPPQPLPPLPPPAPTTVVNPSENPPTEFEVASIKPGDPVDRRVMIMIAPGGRFNAKNINVRFLIEQAYGVRNFQVTGGPSWTESEKYVIDAKAERPVSPEQLKPLLQALLATRFHLKLRRETKELPVYNLVVAKGGPKMPAPEASDKKGGLTRMGRGSIDAERLPMFGLANTLANMLGRNVIDKTGLTGNYTVKLEWTPDDSQTLGPKDVGGDTAPPVASSGPTIFTAIQEQLGLKLESSKGPVEILIIESIDKPTEN